MSTDARTLAEWVKLKWEFGLRGIPDEVLVAAQRVLAAPVALDRPQPATIYYIEERRGPTREGPWSEWGDDPKAAERIVGRSFTSLRELTADECRARCMSIDSDGRQEWRELRCIPYHRGTPEKPYCACSSPGCDICHPSAGNGHLYSEDVW